MSNMVLRDASASKNQFGGSWSYSCPTLGIAKCLLLCDRDQSPAAVLFLEERWSDHQPRNAFQPFQFYKPELFKGTLAHTVPGYSQVLCIALVLQYQRQHHTFTHTLSILQYHSNEPSFRYNIVPTPHEQEQN